MTDHTEGGEFKISNVMLDQIPESELMEHGMLLSKKYELADQKNPERSGGNSAAQTSPGQSEVLEPRYSFDKLGALPDISPVLKTCIDVMATNVSRFGGKLVPLYDVVDAKKTLEDGTQVTVKVNRDTREEIPEEVLIERQEEFIRASKFFASASLDIPFTELLYQKHVNLETYGNSFWEVERDIKYEQPVGVCQLKTESIRMLPQDKYAIEVRQFVLNPVDFEWIEIERMKRFRRFVQYGKGGKKLYFKEFGDPRRMNALTGAYIMPDEDPPADQDWIEATEVLHWKLYHPRDEYGCPRFVARTPHILGTRAADLVNYSLLRNNAIPPVAVIVEGYNSKDIEQQIKEWLKAKQRKGDTFSSMLILSAGMQSGGPVGSGAKPTKPSIRIEPMSQVMTKDGTFIEYIKSNDEGIVGSFRLTNQFVGMTANINRATAEVADEIVQKQVFIPERMAQDMFINSTLMNALRIKYWRYETNAVMLEDSSEKAKLALDFTEKGGITFRELRRVAKDTLGLELEEIEDPVMDKIKPVFDAEARLGLLPESGSDPAPRAAAETGGADLDTGADTSAGRAEDQVANQEQAQAQAKALLQEVEDDDLAVQLISKLISLRDGIQIRKAYLLNESEIPAVLSEVA